MIELKNLNKVYVNKGNIKHHALKNINLKFENTGMTFIVGPSGGGKSTLLNVISGLDGFDSGSMLIKGVDSKQLNAKAIDSYRNTYGGFIFQDFNLLDHLTLGENVALGVELQGRKPNSQEIAEVFKKLGIAGMENRYPPEISGGQRQRVAIARALLKKPAVLFADEPSGSVDRSTRKVIFNILKDLSKEILIIAVTHSTEIAAQYADRIISIEDGVITSDTHFEQDGENSLYNKQVMFIKPGKKLGLHEIDELNDVLENSKTKGTYICLEDSVKNVNSQYSKAMEQLKADNAKKAKLAKEKADAKKKEDNTPFRLITAKLPAKTSAKLSFSNFATNKLRTAFTIILTVLALTLFTVSSILTGFNHNRANIECFLDSNAPYISIEKEQGVFDGEDLAKYYKDSKTDYSNNSLQLVHQFGDHKGLASITLDGTNIVEIGKYIVYNENAEAQKNAFKQELLFGTWATAGDEIVISNYVAEMIKFKGATTAGANIAKGTEIENMIGKSVYVEAIDKVLKIAGIYESNWESCFEKTDSGEIIEKPLSKVLINQAEYLKENTFNVIYVDENFALQNIAGESINYNTGINTNNFIGLITASNGKALYYSDINQLNITTRLTDSTIGSIKYKITTAGTKTRTNLSNLTIKIGDYVVYNESFDNVEQDDTLPENTISLCKEDYDKLISAITAPATEVYASSAISEKEFMNLVKSNDDISLISYNSGEIEEFAHRFGVAGDGLLIASIVLAMFAILMLYNFISQSIRSKYKNIGILRSIGARMQDVIGIFLLEALILSVAIILGAFALGGITTVILNIVVRANTVYALNLFTYKFGIFGIVSAIVAVVAFASYMIPMIKISKTKPFDIIKNNSNN